MSSARRPYHSSVRAERARETRRGLVEAATARFLDAGYASTSLAEVAEAAGVSVDTVYKTFGSKIALLKELLDVAIGGDDAPVSLLERAAPRALREEADQRVQVRMLAAGVTRQLERIRPLDDILRGAAAVDAEAAALREDIQVRQRRTAMRTIVGWIAANGPLRDGLSVNRAAQMVWTLTSPEVHLLMRETGGWSERAYRAWLEQAIADGILGQPVSPAVGQPGSRA
ncbi:MAG: helix-turn-helix domain-containing protein [Marmoricola sp.]